MTTKSIKFTLLRKRCAKIWTTRVSSCLIGCCPSLPLLTGVVNHNLDLLEILLLWGSDSHMRIVSAYDVLDKIAQLIEKGRHCPVVSL